MKIANSSKILCSALMLSVLAVSCSKKNQAAEDPVADESKIVTGTMEVTSPKQDYSSLKPVETVTKSVSDEFDSFMNDLGSNITDLASSSVEGLNGIIDSIKDSDTVTAITDKINETAESLKNPETYTNLLDTAKDKAAEIGENIKNSDVVNNLTDTVSSAVENLGIGGGGVDAETQSALDSLNSLVGDWAGKLKF